MDKYHTLFLSDNGSVYSCGFGVGGRLGHDNEEPVLVSDRRATIVLTECIDPQTNHGHGNHQRNRARSLLLHSGNTGLFLFSHWKVIDVRNEREIRHECCSRGSLWSCGLNNYHQLGHPGVTKLLVPTKVRQPSLISRLEITEYILSRFNFGNWKITKSLISLAGDFMWRWSSTMVN